MRDVPQAQRNNYRSATGNPRALSTLRTMRLRTRAFDGDGMEPGGVKTSHAITSGQGELAFLGDALESFARALDPVLAIIPFSRQLTDHLVGAGGGRTRHIACSEIDGHSNRELVLQRPLHTQIFWPFRARSPMRRPVENPAAS